MNFKQLAESLNPQTYQAIKQSVEIGKWPNGVALTSEQQALCIEALITYEQHHLPQNEHTGFMPDQCKSKADSIEVIEQS